MSDQLSNDEPIVIAHFVPPANDPWGDNLRPVTVFQVLQAGASLGDSVITEGKSFGAVTLVAHVTDVEINPAHASFFLEDGTGKIRADRELASVIHQHGLSAEAEEKEITQYRAFVHTYVEVIGTLKNSTKWRSKIKIGSIHPVHNYHQVMYHILNVIHSDMLSQQSIQDFGASEHMEDMPIDDGQTSQNDASTSCHITYALSSSTPILSNTFSPQRHRPYVTLKPLERAIMKHMCHHRNHHFLIAELAQAIQESCGCTEFQFNLAVQALLSEAYITSPLDDGYVVVTPRH